MGNMLDDYKKAVINLEKDRANYNLLYNINTSKRQNLILPKGQTFANLIVISNLEIGNIEFERFRLNKLLMHIDEIKNMEDAYVVLGGNIFYCDNELIKKEKNLQTSVFDIEDECYTMLWQARVVKEILEPIKDKIVGVYDGEYEKKYILRTPVNPSLSLCKLLGAPYLYYGDNLELDVTFDNSWTKNTSQTVKCYFNHGFLSSATFNTTYNKTEGMMKKIGGKDVYISSRYNMFMHSVESKITAEDKEHTMKQNQHFISVSGYKDYYIKRLKERNSKPCYTDNKILRLYVTPNQDVNNNRGNHNIIEPEFKICCDDIDFGRCKLEDFNFELMTQVSMITRTNSAVAEFLKQYIDNKTEILTKASTAKVIGKTYQGKYHVKTKLPSRKLLIKKEPPKKQEGTQLSLFDDENIEDKGLER